MGVYKCRRRRAATAAEKGLLPFYANSVACHTFTILRQKPLTFTEPSPYAPGPPRRAPRVASVLHPCRVTCMYRTPARSCSVQKEVFQFVVTQSQRESPSRPAARQGREGPGVGGVKSGNTHLFFPDAH